MICILNTKWEIGMIIELNGILERYNGDRYRTEDILTLFDCDASNTIKFKNEYEFFDKIDNNPDKRQPINPR